MPLRPLSRRPVTPDTPFIFLIVILGYEVSDTLEGRKPETQVCTVKTHTLGVPTLLIQHER